MKKLFLFISMLVLVASGCATQHGGPFDHMAQNIQPDQSGLTLEQIMELATYSEGTKISDMTALTTADSADLFVIVDTSVSQTKNITKANLMGTPGAIGETTPAAGTFTTLNTGQGNYELFGMNQDVESTDSPIFVTTKNSGLGDGFLPYHIDDSTGFGDSPLSRTDANTITLQAAASAAAVLQLFADAAGDNSDKWQLVAADGGDWTLESYQSGSWVAVLTIDNTGNITMTSVETTATTAPGISGTDSDQDDPDIIGKDYWNASATGSGVEVGDKYWQVMGGAGTAGTLETFMDYDASNRALTIQGSINSAPHTFTFTTEANIDTILTSTVYLLDGDDDGENDAIDLQNGTTAGQILYLIASADIDANDTCTISYADTTCTNCPATVFDKVGENVHLIWTGTTWAVISLQDGL